MSIIKRNKFNICIQTRPRGATKKEEIERERIIAK